MHSRLIQRHRATAGAHAGLVDYLAVAADEQYLAFRSLVSGLQLLDYVKVSRAEESKSPLLAV